MWSQPLLLSVSVVLADLQVTTASVIRACSSSRLAGRAGTNTLSLTYPHAVNSRGVNSGDHGGQAIVPPRPIQANTVG